MEKLLPMEVKPPGSSNSRAVSDPELQKMEVHRAEGKEMRQLRFQKHQALSSKGEGWIHNTNNAAC